MQAPKREVACLVLWQPDAAWSLIRGLPRGYSCDIVGSRKQQSVIVARVTGGYVVVNACHRDHCISKRSSASGFPHKTSHANVNLESDQDSSMKRHACLLDKQAINQCLYDYLLHVSQQRLSVVLPLCWQIWRHGKLAATQLHGDFQAVPF